MEKVYRILSWIFGVFASISGLAFLTISLIGGLVFLLIGLLLLPPVRDYVFNKYNVSITGTTRGVLIAVFFFTSMGFIISDGADSQVAKEQEEIKAAAAKKEQEKKDNLEYFAKNKSTILAQLNSKLESKDYKGVVDGAKKYLATNDAELNSVHNKAKERTLLDQLNNTTIDPSNFNFLRSIYQQLSAIDPNSKDYKKNAEYYAKQVKIVEDKKKEEALKLARAAERQKQIEAQFSAWDGSHRGLERVVKDAMNDPDSYDHVETRYIDKGDYLIVITSFRGKNAFGGVVKNTVRAKVDMNGNVFQIIE